MRIIRLFLFAVTAATILSAAETLISDTIITPFYRLLFNGKVSITGMDMTTAAGDTVARWTTSVDVINGSFSIRLQPNDTALPAGTYYTVRYEPSPITRGPSWTETWTFTTSTPALKINQVRVLTIPSPGLSILPSQISRAAATTGQALLWSGTTWAPGTVASGSGMAWAALAPVHSATPTFDLALAGRWQPGAMTANVTSVTFSNKVAGMKFSLVWTQDGTGGRTVAYGASASGTCAVSPTLNVATTQQFEIAADGTTVLGVGCFIPMGVNTQSGTTYTIQASDLGRVIVFTSGSSITLTVAPSLGAGFHCVVVQKGVGQITFVPGSGVTIRQADALDKTRRQYSYASIVIVATDEVLLTGDLV